MGDMSEDELRAYVTHLANERITRANNRETYKRRFSADPAAWVSERLHEHLWSGEVKILESVRDHRKTLVRSCHEVGKSFTAARAACWWLDTHDPGEAFVVTSAPTAYQVKSVLWREIGRAHKKAKLSGRLNLTEWWARVDGKDELVAFGRKPDGYDVSVFQGLHARYMFVILDEACGIRGPLWEGADSLIANDRGKLLAIGNPDDPRSEFYENAKPGSGFHVVEINAFESPNFTGDASVPLNIKANLIGRTYVEEKRLRWARSWRWVDAAGETCNVEHGVRVVPPCDPTDEKAIAKALSLVNPYWCSKVLGQFPPVNAGGTLIPQHLIEQACDRELKPGTPNTLGVDVGGGGDPSCICHRRGGVYRIVHEDNNPDTMQTVGNVVDIWRQTQSTEIRVDTIGIGKGVVDRLKELDELKGKVEVVGVNVAVKAIEPKFYLNLKSEAYWAVRSDFEAGSVDIDTLDEELRSQLADIRGERSSKGTLKIESKEDAKSRGVASPNRAEAMMLSRVTLPPSQRPAGGAAVLASW